MPSGSLSPTVYSTVVAVGFSPVWSPTGMPAHLFRTYRIDSAGNRRVDSEGNPRVVDRFGHLVIPQGERISVRGFAPVIELSVTPTTEAISVLGYTPEVGYGVTPPAEIILILGYIPSVGYEVLPSVGTVSVLSYGPTIDVI